VETFGLQTLANMLLITLGVCIASYGELNFDMYGFLLQMVRRGARGGSAQEVATQYMHELSCDPRLRWGSL
jgi:hypothetical protein